MIVKIISKIDSISSLNRANNYINDDDKCITPIEIENANLDDEIKNGLQEEFNSITNESYGNTDGNEIKNGINRVIEYMANEEKIKKKYISGYLCNANTASEEILRNIEKHMLMKGKTLDDATGHMAYHIVQSFPEEIEISDEEIHQCGIELVEKLNLYQAVIASHVHPEIDETTGEIKGKCKHNHIIFSAYRHVDFIDKGNPNVIKYNDCRESYNQLQLWNDEIAVAHGLPIIIEPDMNKTYSWYESQEANKGTSWKERVRLDIKNAKRISNNWDEFIRVMEKNDYKIRDKTHVTYITPDDKPDERKRVRDNTLGKEYTKEYILSYFDLKKNINFEIDTKEDEINESNIDLHKLLEQHENILYVKIPKAKSGKHADKIGTTGTKYMMYLPLNNQIQENSVTSYFNQNKIYDICDENHRTIVQVSGKILFEFFINKTKEQETENLRRLEEEMKEYNDQQGKVNYNKKTYYRIDWVHYKTKKPAQVYVYDEYGRRRSSIELLALLAILMINKESINWLSLPYDSTLKNHPIYAKRDWKIQNMLDTIEIARKENIRSKKDIETRLLNTGKKISQIKRDIKYKQNALDRMNSIYQTIQKYETVKNICEELYAMPKSMEKEKLIRKHKVELEIYTETKAELHHKNINSENDIDDFLNRYSDIDSKVKNLTEQLEEAKQDYRKFKKVEYNVQLAQNTQYACGVNYEYRKILNTKTEDLKVNTLSEEELEEKQKQQIKR